MTDQLPENRKAGSKPLTVLVVDDHPPMRRAICEYLDLLLPGARILQQGAGAGTVSLALETRPDLVVMDVQLPDASGIDLTREIRQTCPATRVIVTSLYAKEDIEAQALAAGAVEFAAKEHLFSCIARHCSALQG